MVCSKIFLSTYPTVTNSAINLQRHAYSKIRNSAFLPSKLIKKDTHFIASYQSRGSSKAKQQTENRPWKRNHMYQNRYPLYGICWGTMTTYIQQPALITQIQLGSFIPLFTHLFDLAPGRGVFFTDGFEFGVCD